MHKLSAAIMRKYKEDALCTHLERIHDLYCCGSMSHELAEHLLEDFDSFPAELFVWSYINVRAKEIREELESPRVSTRERWALMSELVQLEKELGDSKKKTVELFAQYNFTFYEDHELLDESLMLLAESIKEEPTKLKHTCKYLEAIGSEKLVERFKALIKLDEIEECLIDDPTSKKKLKLIREKLRLRKTLEELRQIK